MFADYYCVGCEMNKSKHKMHVIKGELGICLSCAEEMHTTKEMSFVPRDNLDAVVAPFLYDGSVARAVKEFKFNSQKAYGEFLTSLACYFLRDFNYFDGYEIIVPVPLHQNRLLERGFNQSEIIAEVLSREYGIDMLTDALFRLRDTEHQSMLKGYKRIENVRDAFVAAENLVKDKKVILVDDIYTMGETANQCAKALKEAGASKVLAFDLCKTV